MNIPGLVEYLQGGAELAAVHLAPCLPFLNFLLLIDVVDALHVAEDRRPVLLA